MEQGVLLRVIMILTGAALLSVTFLSLAKRRMAEPFCLTWGLISVMIISAGILLRPVQWNRCISGSGLALVLLAGFCLIYVAYFMSVRISELMRKNLELSMQVSLLNTEIEELKSMITGQSGEKEGDTQNYEKDSDCD